MDFVILRERQLRFRAARYALKRPSGARGPDAVASNLFRGLSQIGISVRELREPVPPALTTRRIGVLSGVDNVRWLASSAGRTLRNSAHTVVGPNVCVLPSDLPAVDWSVFDRIIVPCPWVADVWVADDPTLASKVSIWAAGVDTDFWRPHANADRPVGLIYDKLLDPTRVESLQKAITRVGLEPRVVRYGRHSRDDYLEVLRRSAFMVWLSRSESQGLAMVEAWSTDVPTLCVDPTEWRSTAAPWHLQNSSPSPYLTTETGAMVRDSDDPQWALNEFVSRLDSFSPRRSVVDRFSLSASAKAYAALFPQAKPAS